MDDYRHTPTQRRYGYHITLATARRVWAALTAEPSKSLVAIAADLRLSVSCVSAARRLLRDAGYVDFEDHTIGTTTRILIPFRVLHEKCSPARLEE